MTEQNPLEEETVRHIDEATRDQDTKEAVSLIKEYLVPVCTGLLLAVIALGIFQLYRSNKQSVNDLASQRLFTARSAEDVQSILSEYSTTPVAALAQFKFATLLYDQGEYERAQHAFIAFMQNFDDHTLLPNAIWGAANCVEAKGQFQDAITRYQEFLSQHPDHYLTPLAKLAKARCLVELGELEEARIQFENILVNHPDSVWTDAVDASLQLVEKKSRQ